MGCSVSMIVMARDRSRPASQHRSQKPCSRSVSEHPAKPRLTIQAAMLSTSSLRILGFTVAERPVFLPHLDEVDEDILPAKVEPAVQPVGNRLVEGPLLIDGAAIAQGDLDDHAIGGALNPGVIGIDDEIRRRVLRDDLEAVIFRDIDGADHRFVNDFTYRAAIIRRFAGDKVNADDWHEHFPQLDIPTIIPRYYCRGGRLSSIRPGPASSPASIALPV